MVISLMEEKESANSSIKDVIKQKIKEKIKKELLDEIREELQLEEEELTEEIISMLTQRVSNGLNIKHSKAPIVNILEKKVIEPQLEQEAQKETYITIKATLKIASHAIKYANPNIPKSNWIEVIGILAGKIDKKTGLLIIEDAYPVGHGNAIHAKMDDKRNRRTGFIKAFEIIKKNKLDICGWYHSHPCYGCFMSPEDFDTQARYQKLWDKAVALVIDPCLIDGTSTGFEIYQADLKSKTFYPLLYGIKGSLDIRMLPDILEFMNPIIQGKAAYLEYDKD